MKVEMEIVRSPTHHTKALQPSKPLMIDERWAERIEQISKGKIRRVIPSVEVELEEKTSRRNRRNRA